MKAPPVYNYSVHNKNDYSESLNRFLISFFYCTVCRSGQSSYLLYIHCSPCVIYVLCDSAEYTLHTLYYFFFFTAINWTIVRCKEYYFFSVFTIPQFMCNELIFGQKTFFFSFQIRKICAEILREWNIKISETIRNEKQIHRFMVLMVLVAKIAKTLMLYTHSWFSANPVDPERISVYGPLHF